MSFELAVHKKAVEIGKLSVEMTTAAGSGHPSTALSLSHLIAVLMYHQMRWDPKDPWSPTADRLVLSEGHAVPIIYAAYADLGGVITPPGRIVTVRALPGNDCRDDPEVTATAAAPSSARWTTPLPWTATVLPAGLYATGACVPGSMRTPSAVPACALALTIVAAYISS